MHFGVIEKPYNNAGLIAKVSEEIASENVENCRFRHDNPTIV